MGSNTEKQAFWLLKKINRAIYEYGMVQAGERVAVALSGGKDSLSLLKLLDFRTNTSREKYELVAIHVTSDARGPGTPVHNPLIEWLRNSGYQYSVVGIGLEESEPLPMSCQRCTWNRRKTLFAEAARLGCSVIAFGHHADDLAQTTLLNLLYHGKVETMVPCRTYFGGQIRLVRPLCYVDEKDIRRFSKVCAFPPPPPDCSRSDQSRRKMAKEIIQQTSRKCQDARTNLLRAGLRGNQIWEEQ